MASKCFKLVLSWAHVSGICFLRHLSYWLLIAQVIPLPNPSLRSAPVVVLLSEHHDQLREVQFEPNHRDKVSQHTDLCIGGEQYDWVVFSTPKLFTLSSFDFVSLCESPTL